jgi:hypothetical protein
MEDIKKNNETMNQEEKQNENATPDQNKAEQKQPGKIGAFFKKHKSKIKTGLAIAGGVAVGVAADKFGLRLGKKKDDDRPATEADV